MIQRILALLAACAGVLVAQQTSQPADDLTALSIQDLFQVQVTSVGKKAQQLSKAPAAVHVLTSDDIRRSGATSIPEALQWVPGLTVSNIDGHDWMVSARGSSRLYADKMLVMIDGRSLYTPLFSGVLWDSVDVPLEDIDRIEVVLGPGAVMWGPNAVNGVINIITKSSTNTKGGELAAKTGNELHGSLLTRWGGELKRNITYRVWGKADEDNPAYSSPGYFVVGQPIASPVPVTDLEAESVRVGFRADAPVTAKDQIMVEGDLYKIGGQTPLGYPTWQSVALQTSEVHTGYDGGYLLGSWTHTNSADDEQGLQFSYYKYGIDYNFLSGTMANTTLDYQKRLRTSEANEIFLGGGFQQYSDDTVPHYFASFSPPAATYRDGYVVLRDELQVLPKLLLSAGSRFDYNSWTRFEYQPSVRLLFTPTARQSLWFAASRAVRTPSRYNRDLQAFADPETFMGMPVAIEEVGSHTIRSEVERSLETGYRLQSGPHLSFDVSTFLSFYNRLDAMQISPEPVITMLGQTPVLTLLSPESNIGTGRSFGGELSATWQLSPEWKIIPSYSYLNENRWLPYSPLGLNQWDDTFADPRSQALLRVEHDLFRNWQLNFGARARSRTTTEEYQLPGSLLFDAQISWRATRTTSFSFSVHNLLNREVLAAYSEPPFIAIPLRRTMILAWRQAF